MRYSKGCLLLGGMMAMAFLLLMPACKQNKSAGKTDAGKLDEGEANAKLDTRFQELFFDALLNKANGEWQKSYNALEECLRLEPKNGAVHFELGRFDLDNKKDIESAHVHAKSALATDKNNPWYHLLLGKVLLGKGDYNGASKAFANVAKLNPYDTNVLYEQADAQINAKLYADAIKTYDQIELKTGVYEELSVRKNKLYGDLGKWDQAALELERLAEQFPDVPQYWAMLSQFYQKLGKQKEAAIAMEKMLYADPNNGQAHFQMSEFYRTNGELKRANDEMKLAFKSTEVTIDQKIAVMIRYLEATNSDPSQLQEAMELLKILESTHPSEAKTHSIAGDFYYRDGRPHEALGSYRKAVEIDPDRNLIWQQILILDQETQNTAAMLEDSEKALELFPNEPVFYYYNGLYHQSVKAHAMAVESFRIGKDMVVDNDALMVRFLAGLGDEYYRLNDYKRSDEAFDAALRLMPNEVYILNNYAYFLCLRKERLEQAEQMARYANELVPNEPSYLDTYAWVLYQRGKYNEALVLIEKAISIDTKSPELFEHYGDILFRMGKTSEARNQWLRAQELGSKEEKLKQKIASGKLVE
jgi:tetratricopeptide (TPR) repeat protein